MILSEKKIGNKRISCKRQVRNDDKVLLFTAPVPYFPATHTSHVCNVRVHRTQEEARVVVD